jgi:transcription elongation GreA/GreB family factor
MRYYFTHNGYRARQRAIQSLEEKIRSVGREAGEAAGINCDWHDNFGYEDAKRRLEMESRRLAELQVEVAGAEIITIREQSDRVAIGVTVEAIVNGEKKELTIGAFGESDPASGLLSYTAPLSGALLGMVENETRVVDLGGRRVAVEVLRIHPPSYRYHRLISALHVDPAGR